MKHVLFTALLLALPAALHAADSLKTEANAAAETSFGAAWPASGPAARGTAQRGGVASGCGIAWNSWNAVFSPPATAVTGETAQTSQR